MENFEWVSKEQLESWTAEDIMNIPTQGETGYAFEVDMIYLKKYHEVLILKKKGGEKVINNFPHFFISEMINFRWLLTMDLLNLKTCHTSTKNF